MAIPVGSKAPDFTLKSKSPADVEVKLSNNHGKKNTVLLFFPLAFTSVCTKEMCDITSGLGAFSDLNADVIGISVDSPFAQAAWAQKENIKITLASDLNSVDISWIVGAVVTAVVYWLLTRNLNAAAEQTAIAESDAGLRQIDSAAASA